MNNEYYTIKKAKNGQDVRQQINEALSYYSWLYSAFFHILTRDFRLNNTQISNKLKDYDFQISPRSVSATMERFPYEDQSRKESC